jgi:8-oxo-dGTP diphosphatase
MSVSPPAENSYNAADYERPSVTADIVIFSILDEQLKVLLVRRKSWPHEGMWAIPGGFVKMDESLEEAAYRELADPGDYRGLRGPGRRR